MIHQMNHRYSKHVITLEDPVEYLFESDKCTIEQRELGDDVPSFASGLRHVLRHTACLHGLNHGVIVSIDLLGGIAP